MRNSRKQLIVKIDKLDKKLHQEQIKVHKHADCLASVVNSTTVIVGLLPAFLIGWGSAKGKFLKNMLKYIIRIELVAILTTVSKKLIK